MPLPIEELRSLARFENLTETVSAGSLRAQSPEVLDDFLTHYRFAATALARVRDAGDDPVLERRINAALARGHAILYVKRGPRLSRLWELLVFDFPARVRALREAVWLAVLVFVGMGGVAFLAVESNPRIAYSLFSPAEVAHQEALLADSRPFTGNFTFDVGDAPLIGPLIAINNVRVAIFSFVGGVLVFPTILILGFNGMMVGTFFGLASAHGRLFDMASLLMCHGTLELTAILLAAAAGIHVGLAVLNPGRRTRRVAIVAAGANAIVVVFGVGATLLVAASIEAFVTPFTTPTIRTAVAIATGILYLGFLWGSGRGRGARIV